jgi:cytidine deaminase
MQLLACTTSGKPDSGGHHESWYDPNSAFGAFAMTPDLDLLRSRAVEAALRAYSPYSKFRVGAALRCPGGAIYSGCNVENASYGLTICAERNAVFQMVAAGERKLDVIVIYTPTATPTAPCGACRQVLNEFNPDVEVISVCDGPGEIRCTLRELLPGAFGPANLA